MHQLIDKKKKIYFYLIFLIFLSSIFNLELKKSFEQFFLIKNIQYENKNLDINLNQYYNTNIFYLDKVEITSLINKNPIINSFKINKIYPNTLKINFEKTNPVASIFINGDIFYIGENEKIFKDAQYETEVPIIKGFVDLNEINKFLRILKESQLNSMGIEYLVYHQSKRWDIFFKNDINLKLPINVDQNTINNASRLLKDENFKKKIIDLRIKNKIIVTNE